MTREMIITELNNRGYNAYPQTNIKNGVEFDGIVIRNNTKIAPVIYPDAIIQNADADNMDLDEIVSAIINTYEAHKSIDFDLDEHMSRDFLESHLFIGLQKTSNEALVKRPCEFDGIECYLYINGNDYSIKVTTGFLSQTDLTEEEAWLFAEKNTYAETTIQSMAMVMAEMLGMNYSEEMDETTPFYVISNTVRFRGASAILNKEMLSEFGRKHNTNKIVVLPSSIHEMLLLPYAEEMDIDEFSAMVGEINGAQVAPEERLTDRAYIVML